MYFYQLYSLIVGLSLPHEKVLMFKMVNSIKQLFVTAFTVQVVVSPMSTEPVLLVTLAEWRKEKKWKEKKKGTGLQYLQVRHSEGNY